jgi:hypothetical protein
MTNSLILSNIPYNFFNEPWLKKDGIESMVWEMYEEFATDKNYYPIPKWEYFIEDENELTVFHNEVISYLTFADFTRYLYPEEEADYDRFGDMFEHRSDEIDEDFIHLFDEMRLALVDTSDECKHFPIVQVW